MNPVRRTASLVLIALVFVMEGYDLMAMSLAAPRLEPLGLDPAQFGWVYTAMLVGIGLGGAVLAPFGDRIGRRPLIVFGCIAVAALTLATTLATTLPQFLAWRLLTGMAFGACLPNCSALSAELAPERIRATVMALVSAGIPLGLAAAGLFAPEVVAIGGWQALFVVPGLFAALLGVVLWPVLPGEAARSERAPRASRLPQLELFRAPWRVPFAVVATLLSLNAMNLYLLNSWLPTVLPRAGFSLDDAARIAGVVQLAGLAIGVVASVLIDRWRPGATMIGLFALMAACFAAIGAIAPGAGWIALLMVGVGGASAASMALPALCAYLFPPRLLSSAVGMGVMVARLGAFAGPPLGQAMLDVDVAPQMFLASAALPAGIAALIGLAIPVALAVLRRQEATA
ncbi:MAG TPA: MFS transporter [Croceibacterium sp.]|nr:MFS transporter [Croceibacterium sp.]